MATLPAGSTSVTPGTAPSADLAASLSRALERLAAGDLSASVDLAAPDEDTPFTRLAAQLNRTIEALRERDAVRSVFGQYVRPAVADALLRGDVKLGGERRDVSVLMTDIRSFTALTETLPPDALVRMLNRYFGHMIDAVLEFEGTVDKFIGDALLIEFNAPVAQDFHQLRAVLTALRMRERLADFNRDQTRRGEPVMRIGIGINSGLGIVGNIGSEGRRLEYTVMGDAVNCAALLESHTKQISHDVVISAETYVLCADFVDVGEPVKLTPKARAEPLVAYPVLDLKPGLALGPSLLDLARARAGQSGTAALSPAALAASDRERLLRDLDLRATAQRATLESVMASMSDGLLVTDTRRQVRFCNQRAAGALRASSAALIGRPAEAIFAALRGDLFAPNDVQAAWERALAAPEQRPTFEVRLLPPRAAVFHAQVFPVTDVTAGGARTGAGLILRDVSALEAENERKHAELERASAIQQRLLPKTIETWPGALEIAVRFRPAVETAGDFYDVLPLAAAEGSPFPPLQIAVGDVAGKGMAAALVTALARSALRATAFLPVASAVPSSTLRLAGQRLHRDVGAQHFVACALAVLEPPGFHHAGPRLRLANAAQVPVLLVRDGAVEELTPAGYRLPLGVHPDGDYQDISVQLRSGDVVVFSSDGLVEAPAAGARELLGFQRLSEVVCRAGVSERSAEDIAEHIWSAVTSWTDPHPSHDDMTLVVLRVPA